MKMRTAIVVGATGLTGSSLVKQLCGNNKYVSVAVIARRKLAFEHPKLEVKILSLDTIEESDIGFADELFCCLGTTQKKAGSKEEFEKVDFEYPLRIASLAKKRGIPHMLVMSAMGVKETSPFYYSRVKGKLENDLIELGLPKLSIIRPSLLVGNRGEFRLGEKAGELVLKVANPLLLGPLKKFRSIEAAQVAKAMIVIALQEKKEAVMIYESMALAKMDFTQEEDKFATEEIIINRDKFKNSDLVDKDVHFKRQKKDDN
ncbi:MAG: NAD(P)H-binding protein [Lysinibacillus sp.]